MALPTEKDPVADLAAVFGGPKKGGAKAPPVGGMDEEMPEESDELTPAFLTAAEEAFNAELPFEDRAAALKAAIKECLSHEDY